MQKTIITLAGLLFTFMLFCSCDPQPPQTDIDGAAATLAGFYQAQTDGDIDKMATYLSREYQKETVAALDYLKKERPDFIPAISLAFRHATYEITAIQPKSGAVHITVKSSEPDMDLLMERAAGNLDRNYATTQERDLAIDAEILKLVINGQIPYIGKEILYILIQENGLWKIDEEIDLSSR